MAFWPLGTDGPSGRKLGIQSPAVRALRWPGARCGGETPGALIGRPECRTCPVCGRADPHDHLFEFRMYSFSLFRLFPPFPLGYLGCSQLCVGGFRLLCDGVSASGQCPSGIWPAGGTLRDPRSGPQKRPWGEVREGSSGVSSGPSCKFNIALGSCSCRSLKPSSLTVRPSGPHEGSYLFLRGLSVVFCACIVVASELLYPYRKASDGNRLSVPARPSRSAVLGPPSGVSFPGTPPHS